MSVFVRTRRPTGLLLALSRGLGGEYLPGLGDTDLFLRVWLQQGVVHAQAQQGEQVSGSTPLSDGELHLVTVTTEGGRLRILHAGKLEGQGVVVETPTLRLQQGDQVYVGGLEEEGATHAAGGGYFKGCLQDLRVGGLALQFFPQEIEEGGGSGGSSASLLPLKMNNVNQGCDGDDACMVSDVRYTNTHIHYAHRYTHIDK